MDIPGICTDMADAAAAGRHAHQARRLRGHRQYLPQALVRLLREPRLTHVVQVLEVLLYRRRGRDSHVIGLRTGHC